MCQIRVALFFFHSSPAHISLVWKYDEQTNRSKSSTYTTTVQTGYQLMEWNANTVCLCKWGAEPPSRTCNQKPCQTSELSSDVKQTQCVWLTASGLILSVVSAVLCSVCCSSLWTAAPNLSVTLSKSYLDLFHECSVIINWLNAPLCIQPKVTMLLIKSQRSFLISEITRPIFSFRSDWIFNVFSASLPFIPKPLLNPAPSFFLFSFIMFYYLWI